MPLRFLADHCVPNIVVESLRNAHHETFRLRDLLPVESPDSVVIAKAQEIEALLLSLNGDFADITAFPPESFAGIIALQLRNHPEILAQLLKRLIAYLDAHPSMAEYHGKLFIVEVNRIRIRE